MRNPAAYYYNRSKARNEQGIIAYKGSQFAEGSALFDMERGKTDALKLTPWQSDTSVSVHSWGYAQNDTYRSAPPLIADRSEEHTYELQSLRRISYAVVCLKKKTKNK